MLELTPARRAKLAVAGRIGGLTTSARIDTEERALSGQRGLRTRFTKGHACRVCPETVFPDELTAAERSRRADALFRAHMARIASAR